MCLHYIYICVCEGNGIDAKVAHAAYHSTKHTKQKEQAKKQTGKSKTNKDRIKDSAKCVR